MILNLIFLRRLRFWNNIFKAYIKRYYVWFIAIIFIVGSFSFVIKSLWPNISRSNVITIGYVGVYTVESIPASIFSLVTEPLFKVDKDGNPKTSLASHWTISEDGKTYIVFLKDNLTWHDDTKVDAKDLSIAISDVQITALNNKAIEFKLANPISSFLLNLDKPVFKTESFYGTEEYRIVDIDKIDNVVKTIKLEPKQKILPRVEIKFYANETQTINALKIGEVKVATVAHANIFETWPNLNVRRMLDESETITIFYNNNDPILSSKELRQALNYAISREQFDGLSAHSPINPSNWSYYESIKKYDFNTGKAKELLAKSQVKNPEITLSVTQDFEKIALQIKENWEAIGVKTTIKKEKIVPDKFQALLTANKLNPDPDQYALWHSTQEKTNITKYKNVKVDKLLEDARLIQDQEERKRIYQEFQETLVNDAPVAFLYHPYKYRVEYINMKDLISKIKID